MEDKNKSLLEIAVSIMKNKKKPQTLKSIEEKVFEKKGIVNPNNQEIAQFDVDFMLSGLFVFLGEDADGNQMWDLKENQQFVPADKIASTFTDLYADDEDVIKNELKDDTIYGDKDVYSTDDDDSDKIDDEDEITAELGLVSADVEDTTEIVRPIQNEDDDEEFSVEEDEDEIALELEKRQKA